MNEIQLIQQVVDQLGPFTGDEDVLLGPGDDSAVINWIAPNNLVVTIDTFLEGRHFPVDAPGDLVGYRGVAATLSDLVAMAAKPRFITVALTVETSSGGWISEFVEGIRTCCAETGVRVIGGNMTRGRKGLTISALGSVPDREFIRRDSIQLGDEIWLTGRVGATAVALSTYPSWQPIPLQELLPQRSSNVMAAYFLPTVRTEFAASVRHYVSALTDVSDGLCAELDNMIRGTELGARVDVAQISMWDRNQQEMALGQDDSYELLMTLPPAKRSELEEGARATQTECCCIGEITSTSGVKYFDNGIEIDQVVGYSHFD